MEGGTAAAAFSPGDRVRLVLADVTERPLVVETSLGRDYALGDRVHLKVDRDGLLLLNG